MDAEYKDLTQHELLALRQDYNLADAHTHQAQSPTQQQIVASLPRLWKEAEQTKQAEIEDRFIKAFFTFHQQPTALTTPTMLVYAASIGMVIATTYFKKRNLSVALITPCFDNLADLIKSMDVPLAPLPEVLLHNPDAVYENLRTHVQSDVIFLVTPNNPTGFELTGTVGTDYRKGFREVIRFCKDHNKILALDFCFASFLVHDQAIPTFDVYQLLEESGVTYIAIEDTGKTWPLQDAKVAMIKTSKDIYQDVYDIQTAFLLNVSPFILNLVTAYIQDSLNDHGHSIAGLLTANRAVVREAFQGTVLRFVEPRAQVSVAWLEIVDPRLTAAALQKRIYDEAGVYVLPGTYFFWDNRQKGERYIRIALARDTVLLKKAIAQMKRLIDTF